MSTEVGTHVFLKKYELLVNESLSLNYILITEALGLHIANLPIRLLHSTVLS